MSTRPAVTRLGTLGSSACGSQVYALDTSKIRDISGEVLGSDGRMQILPAAYWAGTTPEERMRFGVAHGYYLLPTVELVDALREKIAGRKAIEIGAGNGILAEALGIIATDSFQQEQPQYRQLYQRLDQPTVSYGANVEQADADRAIRRHVPEVVLACWVTHKYQPSRHDAGGNQDGVNEENVVQAAEYIFVGNQGVHQSKKIWNREHTIEFPPYVYSRAMNGTPDFIATWKRRARKIG